MKFLLSFFAYLAATVSTAQAQNTIDWDTVNSSLQTVVQDHVDHFTFIEGGYILVDKTKSDLSKGALSFNFNFDSSELNLLSSLDPQRMSVAGQLDVNTITFGSLHKVEFDASIELKGDLLVLLKHINQIFVDCSSVDATDSFKVYLCEYAKGVTHAKNATELKDALTALKNALVSLFPPGYDSEYKDIIEQINIVEQAGTILVSTLVNELELLGLEFSGEFSLTFADTGLQIRAVGATILEADDYADFIGGVESVILGIQNKDQQTLDMITGYSFFIFELLEGIFL